MPVLSRPMATMTTILDYGSEAKVDERWVHVPNLAFLDKLLDDGKIKAVAGLRVTRITKEGIETREALRYIQRDDKGGYSVWMFNQQLNRFDKHYFKNIEEFTSSYHSDIWMFLTLAKKSLLYYVPKASLPSKKELDKAALFPNKNPFRNPARLHVIRSRKFCQYYGMVYMARVIGSEKGNYAVWSNDANTLADSTDPFRIKYGYPAWFDLKYYEHYAQALDEFLARKTMKVPVAVELIVPMRADAGD